jgi:hypothetical protein
MDNQKSKFKNLPTWAVALIAIGLSLAGALGLKAPIQAVVCADYSFVEEK